MARGCYTHRMTTRLDALLLARRARRRREAALAAADALRALAEAGIAARVAGSLADGRFGLHSDIDFLVLSDTSPVEVVRLVEPFVGAFGFDVVMARDLRPSALALVSQAQADEPALRQIARQA